MIKRDIGASGALPNGGGMPPAERQQVCATPLFAGLEENRVARLLQQSSIRRFRSGEIVIEEGAESEYLHILLSGCVEVFTTDQERRHTLLIFADSDLLMPAAAITGEPYLASVRALKTSRILTADAAQLRAEMALCPMLACRLAVHIAGHFRVMLRQLKDNRMRPGPQRLAAYLIHLVNEKGIAGGADLPVTKATLASRLGMTPESLSRSLRLLAEHGVVVRGHRVIINDRAQVERFCKPDPLIDGGESDLVSAW